MDYKPWLFKNVKFPKGAKIQVPTNDGITTPSGAAGFFSPEECARILEVSRQVPDREAITGNGLGARSRSRRISRVREVYPDPTTNWIFEKLETVLLLINRQYQFGITGFFEGAQIYEYPVEGHLNWHMDVAKGYMSARKMSMSVQLNNGDEYDGGDLEFMDFNNKAPRGIGDLIVFPSYLMHRVSRVTRGTRYSWVSWVHGPPFR
jgi:PKHD-type hydroxylase